MKPPHLKKFQNEIKQGKSHLVTCEELEQLIKDNGLDFSVDKVQVIHIGRKTLITIPHYHQKESCLELYDPDGSHSTFYVQLTGGVAKVKKREQDSQRVFDFDKVIHSICGFEEYLRKALVYPESVFKIRQELGCNRVDISRISVLVQPEEERMEDIGEICEYCGFCSPDPLVCQRCRRSLIKLYIKNEESSAETIEPIRKKMCTRRAKKNLVMECVDLISSDDEEEEEEIDNKIRHTKYPEPVTSVFEKEPVITADTEGTDSHFPDSLRGGGIELESLLDSHDVEKAALHCRTVRFGTYKVAPEDKICITEQGLKIKVPSLSKSNGSTVIKIMMKDVVKVLIHFGSASSTPTIFYYVTHESSKKIREALCMTSKNKNHYFDPTSQEELHKRITLLPEQINEEQRLFIKSIYETRCLMEEITWDEANDILVRAAPKDIQLGLKKEKRNVRKTVPSTSQSSTPGGIQMIMVYPPPPTKGGISINTEDYACLKEDQFLNDVIIDFYLKHLWGNVLSEEDRKRTHIFSSFFYKRLTMPPPSHQSGQSDNPKMSAAEKRHARVKGWTKSVNIFEKDFIIIPINEKSHWFLGIICFPGLNGPVRKSDDKPVPNESKKKKKGASVLAGGLNPAKLYGTTITVVPKEKAAKAQTISLLDPDEDACESDRDEAEADDDEMEPNTTDEDTEEEGDLMDEATPKLCSKLKAILDAIKQPCILIFDSLACASRSRVCATLRQYLQIEWNLRYRGLFKDFSKNIFKGAVPKVPQQTNFIDCGVYVLQFVESFFRDPIQDYRMPIRSIKEWFTVEEVNYKRYHIMMLLHALMKEQNVDIKRLNLPYLNLHPPDEEFNDGDEEGHFMDEEEGIEEGEEEEEEEEEEIEEEEQLKMEEIYSKNKRFGQLRSEAPQIKIEVKPRLDESPRSEPMDTTPARVDPVATTLQKIRSESVRSEIVRSETVRPRISEQVTICEASSKRKLPLSLKDIRNPRLSSPQTSIEKVKKMRVE